MNRQGVTHALPTSTSGQDFCLDETCYQLLVSTKLSASKSPLQVRGTPRLSRKSLEGALSPVGSVLEALSSLLDELTGVLLPNRDQHRRGQSSSHRRHLLALASLSASGPLSKPRIAANKNEHSRSKRSADTHGVSSSSQAPLRGGSSNGSAIAPLQQAQDNEASLGGRESGSGNDRKAQQKQGWAFGGKLPEWMPKQIPHLPAPFWVVLAPPGQPDKKRLMTVQDFFKYTEEEGRQFWEELDRDHDNKVSVEDVKAVLRSRKLPEKYASDFIKAARGGRWWSNTIGWDEFKGLMDEREAKMLRAFTSMEVNAAGSLEPQGIEDTLTKVGVSATEEHARAMIKALGAEEDGAVSYGRFRNFLILLPEAKLTEIDPSAIWFEAATMVPFGPPPQTEDDRTGKMLLTAALAGGIASCTSTLLLFPLDTLKTRLQSTAGATFKSIAQSAPEIGIRGLYRGVIPAATGNFVSHGMRTFSYEASFRMLRSLSGGAAELQMQGLASGMGTFLGTCIRIPCEVLKQRLQTGRHANLVEAVGAATRVEGVRGLFRGTVATLSREVPFYVLGMVIYEQLKKARRGTLFGSQGRDLAPWETIALGALAGAMASIGTTPADVMKTRIMTAAVDRAVDPRAILVGIVKNEGVGALFKGAIPRALWTAPQGAMNFAGYELAKKALSQREEEEATGELLTLNKAQ